MANPTAGKLLRSVSKKRDGYMSADNLTALEKAKELFDSEQINSAQKVLLGILKADPQEMRAWILFVNSLSDDDQKITALERCVDFNPENDKAKVSLRKLKRIKSSKNTPVEPIESVSEATKNRLHPSIFIAGALAILVFFFLGIFYIIVRDNTSNRIALKPTATLSPTRTSKPLPTNTPHPTQPFTGNWLSSFGKSEFDDSQTVVLELIAENSVDGWLTTTWPRLVVRCQEDKLETYVDVGMSTHVEYDIDRATVRLRFDNSEAFELPGSLSTDGDAIFFPYPKELLYLMLNTNKMIFGFTPFNADPAITSFNLRGLPNVIDPLLVSCNLQVQDLAPQPTFTPTSSPTAMPMGSSLNLDGDIFGDMWQVEVEKTIVTQSVSSYGMTEKAGFNFLIIFLRVTNLGTEPTFFIQTGKFRIRDGLGNYYDIDETAIITAEYEYDIGVTQEIQPGDTVMELVVFDLPLDYKPYFLVPGDRTVDNDQSI